MNLIQKIALYSLPGYGVMNEVARGVEALGYKAVWRSPDAFSGEDQFEPEFSAVILNGLRGRNDLVRDVYQARGVPVIITDLGYVSRSEGYHQVGLGRLGWVPNFPCPPDRWKRLGIVLETADSDKNAPFLILGQMPGDAQHGLTPQELESKYADWIALIRTHSSRPVWYRPHPVRHVDVEHVARVVAGGLIEEALDGVYAVVTINSTAALSALVAGIPVFCEPSAMYAELAVTDMSVGKEPVFPSDEQRQDYFNRVAYAQWTREEIVSGEAIKWVLEARQKQAGLDYVQETGIDPVKIAADKAALQIAEPLAGPEHGVTTPPPKRGRGRPAIHGKYSKKKGEPVPDGVQTLAVLDGATEMVMADVAPEVEDVGNTVDGGEDQ